MPSPNPIIVYYVPTCAFSVATIAFLAARGINFRTVNIDAQLEERVRLMRAIDQELETPTLEINERYYVAPSLSELKQALSASVPPKSTVPEQIVQSPQPYDAAHGRTA